VVSTTAATAAADSAAMGAATTEEAAIAEVIAIAMMATITSTKSTLAHWDYQRGKFVLGKYLQLGHICKKKYLLI
jgi:anti-sigma-K factor RskA